MFTVLQVCQRCLQLRHEFRSISWQVRVNFSTKLPMKYEVVDLHGIQAFEFCCYLKELVIIGSRIKLQYYHGQACLFSRLSMKRASFLGVHRARIKNPPKSVRLTHNWRIVGRVFMKFLKLRSSNKLPKNVNLH